MGKKNIDIIDIPALQRRGVLKKLPKKENALKYNKGYFDLSKQQMQETYSSVAQSQESPLSFLDNLAQSSTPAQQPTQSDNSEIADLKVKLEDLEYKIDRFIERLARIESKLDETEKKK